MHAHTDGSGTTASAGPPRRAARPRPGRPRAWLALAAALGVLAAACGGGGGGGDALDDPIDAGAGPGQRDVSFKGAGGLRLAGTLTAPERASGGGVVIIPDYGNIDRNGLLDSTPPDPVYADLSTAFVGAGLTTLRYDRRGIGNSKLESGTRLTYDGMVDDGRAAVEFLSQRAEVGKSGLVVVGHNVGGLMAMRVATDPRVKAVVLVSTPGRPMVEVLAEGFARTYGPESATQFRTIVSQFLASGTLPGPEAIPAQFQTVLGQGQGEVLKGLFEVNPAADARQVKVPALIVVGSQSVTVTRADADRLAQAIGPGATVEVAPTGPTLRPIPHDPGTGPVDPNDHGAHTFGARPVNEIARNQQAVSRVADYAAGRLSAR